MLTCTKIGKAPVLRANGVTSLIKVAIAKGSDSQTWEDSFKQAADSVGLNWAWDTAFFTSYQVRLVLLVWEQTLRTTALGQEPGLSSLTKWNQHNQWQSREASCRNTKGGKTEGGERVSGADPWKMEHYSTREEKCGLQTLPPMMSRWKRRGVAL